MLTAALVSPTVAGLYVGRYKAAELLDVSTRVIDDAIKQGELKAFKIGRRILVRREALVEFAERVKFRK